MFEAVEKSRATAHIQSLQKSMHSDASKVKVKGTGIQKAFRNQKAQFVVDTKDAGKRKFFLKLKVILQIDNFMKNKKRK